MNIWLRAQKMFFCELILISHHPENPNFKTVQKVAGIMSGHHSDFKFPERAVMLFMEPEIHDFVAENECEIVGKFVSVTKDFYVYKNVRQ